MTDIIGYGYSIVIFMGGMMGYIKASSLMSLLSGTIFGVASGFGAHRVSNNPKDAVISLVVSVALLLVMGYRFNNSGKFMPAGLVSLLSLLMVIRYGIKCFF